MKYHIPKSWKDITVNQFYLINELDKSEELDYLVNLIAILCNLTIDHVEAMTIQNIKSIGDKLSFVSKMPEKFVNDFKLNGKHYIVDCNISHISGGQYIDLGEYIKQGTDTNIHKILTVFCIPSERKWFKRKALKYGVGYSLNSLADEFKEVSFEIAYPLAVFFCKLLEKSMPVIQVYLEKELNILQKMSEKHLPNTGAG